MVGSHNMRPLFQKTEDGGQKTEMKEEVIKNNRAPQVYPWANKFFPNK